MALTPTSRILAFWHYRYPNRAGFPPVEGVELKPDFRLQDGRLVVRGVIVDTIVELIADAFLDRRSLDEQENDL